MSRALLFTDGACHINPGPGGYGAILKTDAGEKIIQEDFSFTTNNRMELMGVLSGIRELKKTSSEIHIYSDSKYVVNAIREGWVWKWKAKHFKKKKNKDLWTEYIRLSEGMNISLHWVKGHNGHPENERCHVLAQKAVEKVLKEGTQNKDVGYEEGLA
ncbi:MAG: reverse transcriptase-like protein [Cytophagales bacterium]|nr:reverse transcriptase-like protein [Cytophagales bacterium]